MIIYNRKNVIIHWKEITFQSKYNYIQAIKPGSVHMGFVVGKVALGQVFRFYPVNFIPRVLHYKEKKSSSSQGCTISLKAAVRP